ncbi:hypothetical protein LCGC14_0667890 [marine sediment metagenome]|uniref:NTP pyrophosphohydrolase MazG-like domain-containing protein n=1 Tax=marine sediment metagenome TaxID=412755 RepID=A0A0F9TZW7_9ZZZZ|nr:nucleotide pyrophosphohydrolase [bacterium]
MNIREFQALIKDLYFEQDQKRGLKNSYIWLIEEIGELASVLKKKKINLDEASEELSDIFAWTTSIANLLNIDLEAALIKKYPNLCIKCKSNPCVCWK